MRILHGIGNNGKTTYREAKKAALGAYSLTSGLDLLLQKEHRGGATPEIAQLKGKRHTAVNETKQNQTISSQRIKNITSNEEMEGRHLNQNLMQFMPTHKADITTNHKPKITEDDEGTWRRVHLIPFDVTIPKEEKVKDFKHRYLIPELPGILNWMLEGFAEWCKQGLNPPQEVLAATREYR
jgi:putative DNA primase/helicase